MKNLKRIIILVLSVLTISLFAFGCNDKKSTLSSQSSITSEQTSFSQIDSTSIENPPQSQTISSSSVESTNNINSSNTKNSLPQSETTSKQTSLSQIISSASVENSTINNSSSEQNDISFKTLTVNGVNVYGKVSNDTTIYSFLNEITTAVNVSYIICTDLECKNSIPSKTTSLNIGDNTFYLLLQTETKLKLYTITIRRLPLVTVTFNTNGGNLLNAITVNEGTIISVPLPEKAGYTFINWDYDFTNPIIDSFTTSATWQANSNTPYKVEYYLQNIDNEEYSLDSSLTENLT